MQITIRNNTLLRLLGFKPYSKNAFVGLSVTMWLRSLWWRITGTV